MVAHGCFDSVRHNQGIHNASNRDIAAGCAGNCHGDDVFHSRCADGNTTTALIPVRNPDANAGSRIAGSNSCVVADMGFDGVLEHRCINGRANGIAAAGTNAAGYNIIVGIQIGNDAYSVAAIQGGVLVCLSICHNGLDFAFTHGDGQHTGQSIRSAGTGRQDQGEHPVLAQCLNQRCAGLGIQGGALAHLSKNVTGDHFHADGCAAGILRRACRRQSDGENPAVALCQDADILIALQGNFLSHKCLGIRIGYQNIGHCRGCGSARGNTSRNQHCDELLNILSIYLDRALFADQLGTVADAGNGIAVTDDGG